MLELGTDINDIMNNYNYYNNDSSEISYLDDICDISFNENAFSDISLNDFIGDEYETLSSFLHHHDDDNLSTNMSDNIITRAAYDRLIHDRTCPIGKFIRDMNITYGECRDLWPILKKSPKNLRKPYGKRVNQSEKVRRDTARIRNRVHAHHTRMRKRIFAEVLQQLNSLRQTKQAKNIIIIENVQIDEDFFDHEYH